MGIWDWLFGSSQKKKDELYIQGIKIPEAYTALGEWQRKNLGKNPSALRYFEGKEKYPFFFDENNAIYKTFSV
ncbi:hypothetical protein J4424_05490, partial [Candidatus Woesearchaeota archaeon]|nr:hypothetical protein [Candidatus Woesearchaeota archaeon]